MGNKYEAYRPRLGVHVAPVLEQDPHYVAVLGGVVLLFLCYGGRVV